MDGDGARQGHAGGMGASGAFEPLTPDVAVAGGGCCLCRVVGLWGPFVGDGWCGEEEGVLSLERGDRCIASWMFRSDRDFARRDGRAARRDGIARRVERLPGRLA
jgi:hypothetical protein